MTEELMIEQADNGMVLYADELMQVIEDTHSPDGVGRDNLINQLGKYFLDTIRQAMNLEISNRVKIKIDISATQ